MKGACIVDTNVALVANGSCEGVSPACRLATIDFLEDLMAKGRLAIDLEGEIEEEYRNNLVGERPGVGNRFIQMFFSQAAHRVERHSLKKDRAGNYEDFSFTGPLKKFDRSDRKFVALAAATSYPIYNATDSDWLNDRDELTRRGIKIEFVCGTNRAKWFD